MFPIAALFLNPKAKHGDIPAKAELIIIATWPNGRPDEIDLWVGDPTGDPVWYPNPEAGSMNLDRDDRDTIDDTMTVGG